MTTFALAFAWLAVQGTILLGIALILDRILGRRHPDLASRILAGTATLLFVLTVAAFIPAPSLWHWPQAARPATVTAASPTVDPPDEPVADGVIWFRPHLPQAVVAPERQTARGLLFLWLAGFSVSLATVGRSLWYVWRLRRSSRPILDAGIAQECRDLGQRLGVRRPVQLRETARLSIPATIGTVRPTILLPAEWPRWTASERQTALAHELAHIQSCDYLTGLVAVLARAVHFYQPLLYQLASRLRWRNELAADARAAAVVGGRDEYLKALARLALRTDDRSMDRPIGLVMSAHGGDLMGRIEMLRNGKATRRPTGRLKSLAYLGLISLAAGLSTLRGPAQAEPVKRPDRQPFDLSYVCTEQAPQTRGILALRPAELLASPEMREAAKTYRAMFEAAVKQAGSRLPDGLTLADIDQVVMDFQLTTKGTGEPGSRAMMIGASHVVVRMSRDVDWDKAIKALAPGAVCSTHDGIRRYEIKLPFLGPVPILLHTPDARTLVMGTVVADAKSSKPGVHPVPQPGKVRDLGAAWKSVERSSIALMLDNRDGHYGKSFAVDAKPYPAVQQLLERAKGAAVGVEFDNGMKGNLVVDCADKSATAEALKAITELHELISKQSDDGLGAMARRLLDEMLKSAKAECDGTQIRGQATSSVRPEQLLADRMK